MSEKEIKELRKKIDALIRSSDAQTSATREFMDKLDNIMDIILEDIDLDEEVEISKLIQKRDDWQIWVS